MESLLAPVVDSPAYIMPVSEWYLSSKLPDMFGHHQVVFPATSWHILYLM